MLDYNEIKEGKYIVYEDEPWEVLSSHVFRKQANKPQNVTKLRNLITGRVLEHSFHSSDKAKEADIGKRGIKYLYTNRGEYWFCEESDPSKRFKLEEKLIGPGSKFLKANSIVDAMVFDDPSSPKASNGQGKIIGLKLPIKMDLKVIEAHPAVKGNTAQGATKIVKLESGAELQVPMFIKEGDVVRINTETGQYTDRV